MDRRNDLVDIPTKLAYLLYANVKEAPLPLLALFLTTTILSGLTFVRLLYRQLYRTRGYHYLTDC